MYGYTELNYANYSILQRCLVCRWLFRIQDPFDSSLHFISPSIQLCYNSPEN